MQLPTTFPVADMNVLIQFFTNRTANTTRQYVEALYGVEGFALNCLLGGSTQGFGAGLDEVSSPKDAQIKLENALVACGGLKGHQGAGAATVDWKTILGIIVMILQELSPLLGK